MQSHPTSNDALPASTSAAHTALAPPGAREVEVLQRVLGALHVDGVEQLRDQVRGLLLHPSSDAGLRIYVLHADTPRASAMGAGRVQLEPFPVLSPQGRVVGRISVWVQDGLLRALHYARHDDQPVFVLPSPDRIQVAASQAPVSTPTPRVHVDGARQALAGLRAVGAAPVLHAPAAAISDAPTRSGIRRVLAGVIAAIVLLTIAVVAFGAGASGGVDLASARAEGAAAGTSEGATAGDELGAYLGSTEGTLAGRVSTYRPALEAANTRVLAAARAEKLEAQRAAAEAAAAAAAATPVSTDNTTCSGYRDPTGLWMCT